MEIEVVDQKDSEYSAHDGWAWKSFVIYPADVPRIFGGARGHIIAMACGGGREAWGKAFLQTPCRSYTGFDVGTSEGSNWKAFLVFTINLFYFLLTESVVGDGRRHEMADAVGRAAATDRDYRLGTGGYRIFQRSAGKEGDAE